jgi:hypothetical protein
MKSISPGRNGDPLPEGTLVFRIGKNTYASPSAIRENKAHPEMFKPSTNDEDSEGKRLSVWVEELTVADQAWDFMGSRPASTVVACLTVDAVRSIQPPDSFARLDVEWEQAKLDDGSLNTRPGAEGHAGIIGLIQGGRCRNDSNPRKALRSKLADLAAISPVPVPHDIPEEQLRVAAYFIYLGEGDSKQTSEEHWIKAIRQIRRKRVRAHHNLEVH